MTNERIFAGIFATGISYADRRREKHGDYAPLAFLAFDTLTLRFERDCPPDMRREIAADAQGIQDRRGEAFQISTSGQTVTLGCRA